MGMSDLWSHYIVLQEPRKKAALLMGCPLVYHPRQFLSCFGIPILIALETPQNKPPFTLIFVDFYFWCTLYVASREISSEKTSPTPGTKNHQEKFSRRSKDHLTPLLHKTVHLIKTKLKLKFLWGSFHPRLLPSCKDGCDAERIVILATLSLLLEEAQNGQRAWVYR